MRFSLPVKHRSARTKMGRFPSEIGNLMLNGPLELVGFAQYIVVAFGRPAICLVQCRAGYRRANRGHSAAGDGHGCWGYVEAKFFSFSLLSAATASSISPGRNAEKPSNHPSFEVVSWYRVLRLGVAMPCLPAVRVRCASVP